MYHQAQILENCSSSDSSSNSSEDEATHLINVLPEILQHHQKNENYAEVIVPSYTDDEFRLHFKVPRIVCNNLAAEFSESDYFPKKNTGFQKISAEKSILIICWYATHEAAGFRDVADRFDIAMQAICDSKKRLRDVFIGYPGSVHDARVFRNSPLSNSLAAKCGDRFILADSAYPCRRHVLTPYRDNGNLTEKRK
ncbi:hypothetical protein NQ315_008745 [Exocentrus adspersus]|uniref:DDE Tnp4 domain-containing protein n=1 Tax=Exocentrus adspersus TaxID=1586481 RepID=A0AAV8VH99_9CUCU|nr:hypothetical protein NQ315_008745 [Exocentrus adspersus]